MSEIRVLEVFRKATRSDLGNQVGVKLGRRDVEPI